MSLKKLVQSFLLLSVPCTFSYAQIPKDTLMRMPPAWAFGVLYGSYASQNKIEKNVDELLLKGYPIDGLWIDSWFWDYQTKGNGPKGYISFVPDSSGYPSIETLWGKLRENSIKVGLWIWDAIFKDGNESVYDEFETQGFFRRSFISKDQWHNAGGKSFIGEINFSNPKAVRFWGEKLQPFFDKGLDFLKLDRASDIAFLDAAFHLTSKAGKQSKGRGFILSQCHDLENPLLRKYPAKWTGDAKIAWTQPNYPDLRIYAMGALKENIEMLANPKKPHHFIPFLGNDAGGYDFFGSTDTLNNWDELYIRWIQFSSFAPIMMIFSTHKNPRENLPFNFSKTAQENFKRYTLLRQSLFPFRYSSALREKLLGEKWIEGDSLKPYQFIIGKTLLVAPVYEKGALTRMVVLPEGKWVEYHTNQEFEGGREIVARAALTRLPLFVKAGSIIPMILPTQTLENRSRDTLILNLYPSGESAYELYEDDGESEGYLHGEISRVNFKLSEKNKSLEIDPPIGSFTEMKRKRIYLLRFKTHKPREVWQFEGNDSTKESKRIRNTRNGYAIKTDGTKPLKIGWR